MNAEERKLFAERAQGAAPEGVSVFKDSTSNVPTEHEYAVVEIISDDEDGVLYSYVATGDAAGIHWVWGYVQENHPKPDALRILDVKAAARKQQSIELH